MKSIAICAFSLLLSVAAFSQLPGTLSRRIAVLNNNSVSSLVASVKADGFEEVTDATFSNNHLLVFIKNDYLRHQQVYMIEYCGDQLTGYYAPSDAVEGIHLPDELKENGFSLVKGSYFKYRKNDLTVEVIHDASALYESDATHQYVHLSNKNNCHNDQASPWLAPAFTFTPYSIDECLRNLALVNTDVVLALARSAFMEKSRDAATNVVQYEKDKKIIALQYCNDAVKAYSMFIQDDQYKEIEQSLQKAGYKMIKEDSGQNNAIGRAYEKGDYQVVLQYFGDQARSQDRKRAYYLIIANKNTACKK